MKFIIIFILTFLIYPIYLNAAKIYVKIGTTKKESQLKVIKSRLDAMGLNMLYRTTDSRYIVYSGPYQKLKSASYAAKKIQKYYPYAKVLKSKKQEKKQKTEQVKQSISSQQEKEPFFVEIALGNSSTLPHHSIEEGSVIIDEPKDSGMSYTAEAGKIFDNGFSLSLGYMRFNTDELIFSNTYGRVSYTFDKQLVFSPYFGVLAGSSDLKWRSDPIENMSSDSSIDSDSLFIGTQVGIIYNSFEKISYSLGYQSIFMNQNTNIEVDTTNKSSLKYDMIRSLQLGVRYKF